jgi:hypothetical protein
MVKAKNDDLNVNIFAHKIWPKTRKELEKAANSTRAAVDKGEQYIKTLSKEGIKNARKIAVSFKKEKLYYELGRAVAATPKSKWHESAVIEALITEIKNLERENL